MGERKRPFVVRCCVCRKVRSKAGNWYRRSHLPETAVVSHTYCPDCAQVVRANLKRQRQQRSSLNLH